jgi:hypothetical protein
MIKFIKDNCGLVQFSLLILIGILTWQNYLTTKKVEILTEHIIEDNRDFHRDLENIGWYILRMSQHSKTDTTLTK